MKYLNWSPEKNEILKAERGISFEEIALLIESGTYSESRKIPDDLIKKYIFWKLKTMPLLYHTSKMMMKYF